MPSLAVGQAAAITLTAIDQTAEGTVARIVPVAASAASSGVVSYEVAVSMTEVPEGTLAGMTAEIGITTAEAKDVVAVPAIALTGSDGSYAVQVVDGTGATASRAVEVGLLTSSMAEIKSGLAEGESVVVGTTSDQTTTTTGGGGGGIAIPGAVPGGGPGTGPVFRP
jgi:macrolide-specific efflux system membrane fusion protein